MKGVLLFLVILLSILSANAQKQDTTIYQSCRLANDTNHYVGIDKQIIFDSCPQFGKQSDDYNKYILAHIKHYTTTKKRNVRIIISIIIEKDGSVSNLKIIHSVSSNLSNKEAIRVIRDMPKWKPAILHGKPVRMRYFLPVPA